MAAIAEMRSEIGQSKCIVRRGEIGAKNDDKHERVGTGRRGPPRPNPPHCAGRRVLGHHGAEFFAFPQRYDAVAGAGAVPDVEERVRPQLCADRADQPGDASDLVDAAARGRAVLGLPAATLFAGRRDGCDLDRSAAAGERRQLSDPHLGGGAGRDRLRGLSPGSLARRPPGLRRTARSGPVLVPGRRQHRLLAGADPRRLYRDPEGPVEHCLVLVGRTAGDDRAVRHWKLVPQRAFRPGSARRPPIGRAQPPVAPQGCLVGGDPAGAGLLQILLYREPQQLLHLLPDQQIPRVGRERANLSVRLSGVGRGRHLGRRPGRRPDRPQIRLVGLDRRGAAIHPGAALRRSVLDRHSDRRHRPDPGLGLFGDHRLRIGAGAGKGRHGRRAVLRLVLRHGRDRGGGARPARRRDEH